MNQWEMLDTARSRTHARMARRDVSTLCLFIEDPTDLRNTRELQRTI